MTIPLWCKILFGILVIITLIGDLLMTGMFDFLWGKKEEK